MLANGLRFSVIRLVVRIVSFLIYALSHVFAHILTFAITNTQMVFTKFMAIMGKINWYEQYNHLCFLFRHICGLFYQVSVSSWQVSVTSLQSIGNNINPVVNDMIVMSLGLYVLNWIITLIMSHFKKTMGNANYKSKISHLICIYNFISFTTVSFVCVRLLKFVALNLYKGVIWDYTHGVVLSQYFHILCVVSMFIDIFSGTIPSLTEILFEHSFLLFGSIMSVVFWSPYNVAFITLLTLATLIGPLLGPYSYFLMIGTHVLNSLISVYGLLMTQSYNIFSKIGVISLLQNPLLYVFVYFSTIVFLCIYYIHKKKRSIQIEQEQEQKQQQYLILMKQYKATSKKHKAKRKTLRDSINALKRIKCS